MKNKHLNWIRVISFFLLIIVMVNCKKDPVAPPVPIVIKEATDVNKFIYNGLKDYYLWVDQVPNLAPVVRVLL